MRSDKISAFLPKTKKGIFAAVFLLAVGILLLSFSGDGTKKSTQTAEGDTVRYLAALEEETASLCSSVQGVGKCRVMITLEKGEETVYRAGAKIGTTPPRVQAITLALFAFRHRRKPRYRSEIKIKKRNIRKRAGIGISSNKSKGESIQ